MYLNSNPIVNVCRISKGLPGSQLPCSPGSKMTLDIASHEIVFLLDPRRALRHHPKESKAVSWAGWWAMKNSDVLGESTALVPVISGESLFFHHLFLLRAHLWRWHPCCSPLEISPPKLAILGAASEFGEEVATGLTIAGCAKSTSSSNSEHLVSTWLCSRVYCH